MLASVYDYDWKEAARQFKLVTEGYAASPYALASCALSYLLASGRAKEAVEQLERAAQGDPLHPAIRFGLAMCLGRSGQYAEAVAHLRKILDLDRDFFMAYAGLTVLYAAGGKFVEALPFAEKAYSLAPWSPQVIGLLAAVLTGTGELGRGTDLIKRLGSSQTYGAPFGLAIFHTFCGEIDLAADWMEKAIEQRFPAVTTWLQGAQGEPLGNSPRWPKLAALMNLPEAQ